jgi:hypothetical protein
MEENKTNKSKRKHVTQETLKFHALLKNLGSDISPANTERLIKIIENRPDLMEKLKAGANDKSFTIGRAWSIMRKDENTDKSTLVEDEDFEKLLTIVREVILILYEVLGYKEATIIIEEWLEQMLHVIKEKEKENE